MFDPRKTAEPGSVTDQRRQLALHLGMLIALELLEGGKAATPNVRPPANGSIAGIKDDVLERPE